MPVAEFAAVGFLIPAIIGRVLASRKKMSVNSEILPLPAETLGGRRPQRRGDPVGHTRGDGDLPRFAITRVAKPGEAKEHHRPGGKFGDGFAGVEIEANWHVKLTGHKHGDDKNQA
jgi:hypothetical protein